MRPVHRGHKGKQVVDIQTRLAALGYFLGNEGADGFFGSHTELATRVFQQQRLLFSDGIVEDNTWAELVEAGYEPGDRLLYLRVPYMRGDDVLYLQCRLDELGFDCGPVDGIFSASVEVAITEFQRNTGLNVDGIVGETTFDWLRRLRQLDSEGYVAGIPDRFDGYIATQNLSELKVSIDPAHGGLDAGVVAPCGLIEKDINLVLALQLAEALENEGVEVNLLRDDDTSLGVYERIDLANAWGPDIHICLHHGGHSSPSASGVSAHYFANAFHFSRGGRRLAGYMVNAISRDLSRVDLHKDGRNLACLRDVKPLSIIVQPGYLTHPEEGPALADPEIIACEANAILCGIRSYLARL